MRFFKNRLQLYIPNLRRLLQRVNAPVVLPQRRFVRKILVTARAVPLAFLQLPVVLFVQLQMLLLGKLLRTNGTLQNLFLLGGMGRRPVAFPRSARSKLL